MDGNTEARLAEAEKETKRQAALLALLGKQMIDAGLDVPKALRELL